MMALPVRVVNVRESRGPLGRMKPSALRMSALKFSNPGTTRELRSRMTS
jgi:hypothetical protein